MTDDELKALIETYRKDEAQRSNCIWEIFSFLYFNPYFFSHHYISEDTKNDFLVFLYPKIQIFFDRADPQKGKLHTFLYFFTCGYFHHYVNKEILESKKQCVLQEEILLPCLKHSIYAHDTSEAADFIAEYPKKQTFNKNEHFKQYRGTEKRKKALLILLLKCCTIVTDRIISATAIYTGLPVTKLEEMIQEAENSLSTRKKVKQKLSEAINSAYILSESLLRINATPGTEKHKRERIEILLKRRKKLLTRQEELFTIPSNRTIARLLGLSATSINRYIDFLKSDKATGFFESLKDTINT